MQRPVTPSAPGCAPGGRIVMNVMVSDDIDPTPDRIAARLAGRGEPRTWIVDEQFIVDRNAVIACVPEKTIGSRGSARSRDAS